MNEQQVRELLREECRKAGQQRIWAEQNNVSPQYVTDVLKGRREPGDLILQALGLRRVISYEVRE